MCFYKYYKNKVNTNTRKIIINKIGEKMEKLISRLNENTQIIIKGEEI